MKKIIYLTARVPYFPSKGDEVIAYNQIKILSHTHEVYLISLLDKTKDVMLAHNELIKYCSGIYFIQHNKFFSILSVIKTFFNFKPMQVNYFYQNNIASKIEKIINSINPDIIHVQTIRMAQYVLNNAGTKKTIDLIDALALNMLNRSKREKNLILKFICFLESLLIKKYEKRIIPYFKTSFIVSQNDKNFINKYLPAKKIIINPNGVDLKPIERNPEKASLIFQGNMQYFPNIEACIYLVKKILPQVLKKYPYLKLYIIGNYSKEVKALESSNIILTGFLKDFTYYLSRTTLAVYPMLSGSGIQNKVLEAMSCQIPTVISQIVQKGIEGLKDKKHALIANNTEDFADKIIELLDNKKLREQIGKEGYLFIKKEYTWEKNVKKLIEGWK